MTTKNDDRLVQGSKYARAYHHLLEALKVLDEDETPEDEQKLTDPLRDIMDDVWWSMTPEEIKARTPQQATDRLAELEEKAKLTIGEPTVTQEAAMSVEDLAERLYVAYGDSADWKNYQGNPMPKWGELPQNIRDSWSASAQVAARVMQGR